jgi:hypothetical protein
VNETLASGNDTLEAGNETLSSDNSTDSSNSTQDPDLAINKTLANSLLSSIGMYPQSVNGYWI